MECYFFISSMKPLAMNTTMIRTMTATLTQMTSGGMKSSMGYKAAINDMFRLTSTTFAPWIVLESDDKRYARIKALRIIVSALEDRLGVEHFG